MKQKEKRTLQKNDIRTCEITDFGENGEGIGRADGIPVFVSGALIGDLVKIKITKVKKNMAYARTEEILKPSPDRVQPDCAIARQCGGCQILSYAYPAQLRYKEGRVRELLVRIGRFPEEEIAEVLLPVTGMDEPCRFRNKAQVPVGAADHRIVCGYYAPHSHRIVPQEDCLTGDAVCAGILAAVRAWMEEERISAYDEETHTGLVRHVLIRRAFATGEVMVCLVVNRAAPAAHNATVAGVTGDKAAGADAVLSADGLPQPESGFPGLQNLTEELRRVCARGNRLASLCINYNPQRTNVILGRATHTLYGTSYIEDVLCGLRFRISAQSFYQVNPRMTERLYGKVAEHAAKALPDASSPVIWDLYCGIGTISLMLAKRFPEAKVYGVEIVPQAIEDAKENARINGIENAFFFCAAAAGVQSAEGGIEQCAENALVQKDSKRFSDAKEFCSTETKFVHSPKPDGKATDALVLPAPDIIVVDPPRKGLDRALIDTILRAAPAHIIYVSCDPATLSRDLHLFADGGYQLREAAPFDMFPHTTHVETVVALSHQNAQ